MKAVLLALKDYENHMTDEGHQLQMGLAAEGFDLWGKGFDNSVTDAEHIMRAARPDVAVVIDKREWDATMRGAFDKGAGFTNIDKLAEADVFRVTILKDAGSILDYQRAWAAELKPHAYICYYHPESVVRHADWVGREQIIRTHHSIDARRVQLPLNKDRGWALVSGARNRVVYPLRETCIRNREFLGVRVMPHPGYHNCGSCTPHYLDALQSWRVHVCCASAYGFALRKIVESVACGCKVVTDLPKYDVLPEIDGALVRVPTDIEHAALREVITECARKWNIEEAEYWSERARGYYDWRAVGSRLARAIEERWKAWKAD